MNPYPREGPIEAEEPSAPGGSRSHDFRTKPKESNATPNPEDMSVLKAQATASRGAQNKVAPKTALDSSEVRFRLLVESVIDYAIFMIDP